MGAHALFRYDQGSNVLFSEDHAKLESREQVDEFVSEYSTFCKALGKKCWLVTNIDDLFVGGQIADYYAEASLQLITHNFLGIARWATNSWARMSVRTTALKAKMTATIYFSQEEAVAAIDELRRAASG
jgi:hypothetical protein